MEDYLPVYPPLNSVDIQKIITRKKEFSELAALKDESLPKEGGAYNHQEFFVRFMIIADRLINIHEPGTGKTCAFIKAAEHFKGSGSYNRVYIVEKSDSLINEIRRQIWESCAPGVYNSDIGNENILTSRIIKGRINKNIDKWYKFKTYKKFANDIRKMTDDNEIIRKYSKSIIIFDEVHNILSAIEGDEEDGSKDYPEFFRLCKLIKQSKICAVSATPMKNDTRAVAKLINLLLPEGEEMPEDVDNLTLAQMEPFFRGKITYVKSSTKAATPKYMGIMLPAKYVINYPDDTDLNQDINHRARMLTKTFPSGIEIYPTKMGDIQESIYSSIPFEVFKGYNTRASIFTFPPIGNYEDFIKKSRGGKLVWATPSSFAKWPERGKHVSFQQWLYNGGDTSNLGRLSGKMKAIIDIETEAPGCSFIFTHLKNQSGAINIGMIFSLFGFEIFNDNFEQVFTSEDSSQVKQSYPKKRRVAIYTSGMNTNKQETALRLMKSKANVNGEYIKVLIGSKTSGDGLNIYHCRRMHLVSPEWNFSNMIQAINRVLRAQGHEALKEYLHNKATSLGLVGRDYNDYTNFNVEIYRHCIDYRMNEISIEKSNNIDLYMYRYAEQKEFPIRRVFHAMKICAVDAIINRDRNILPADRNYTQECDYELCDYPSWEQLRDPSYDPDWELSRPDLVDTETYDVLYHNTTELKNAILTMLFLRKSLSYLEIFNKFSRNYEEETIIRTINNIRELSVEKITTKDGDRLFIVLGNNGLHLQRQIDMPTTYIRNLSVYETPTMLVIYRKLSDIFAEMNKTTLYYDIAVLENIFAQATKPSKLESTGKESSKSMTEKILIYIESLPEWRRKTLLEESIVNIHTEYTGLLKKKLADIILSLFKGYYYKFSENDLLTGKLVDVYINVIESNSSNSTGYSIVSRSKDPKELTIYKNNESLGWRKPINNEFDKYKDLVDRNIKSELEPFEKYSIYGMILDDKKFRVKWNQVDVDVNSIDRRQVNRGRKCENFSKVELLKIVWEEKIYPPKFKTFSFPKNEQEMRNSIVGIFSNEFTKNFSNDKLKFMYLWNQQADIGRLICEMLKEKLESEGKIYIPYNLY